MLTGLPPVVNPLKPNNCSRGAANVLLYKTEGELITYHLNIHYKAKLKYSGHYNVKDKYMKSSQYPFWDTMDFPQFDKMGARLVITYTK